MPKFAANLTMMYTEHAFLDRFVHRVRPLCSPTARRAGWAIAALGPQEPAA